ncbi:MAG: hypothetical protein RLZZ612_981 [Pseudomonadota bacterium]
MSASHNATEWQDLFPARTQDSPARYAVLGNPIAHSRSPWIHSRFAELTGHAVQYERELVPLDGFAATLQALIAAGLHGCNVTVPFKFEAFAAATHTTQRAQLASACNTLVFSDAGILGDNTDGEGLVRDLTLHAQHTLQGQRILLLGAGGAGAGVLGPLLQQHPRQLVVCNRTHARAVDLVQTHRTYAQQQGCEILALEKEQLEADFDVVINATASSLSGAEPPCPTSVLRAGTLAVDLMYGAAARPFLDWAQAHGAHTRDGLGMLVEQAAVAFERWRGIAPPSAQVLDELAMVVASSVGTLAKS